MNSSRSRLQTIIFSVVSIFLIAHTSAGAEWSANHALWAKAIGEQAYLEACYSVQETSDNGYILAGRRSLGAGGAKSNVFFVKTDANGNVQWSKEIDPYPTFDSHSRVLDVVQAGDGGYVATGWVDTPDYGEEGYLVKIDAMGNLQWHYIYGNVDLGGGYDDDSFESISKTSDGGYILAGVTEALAQRGWTDAWMVKVNAAGRTVWSQVYGGDSLEYAYAVIQATDGGYVFAGSTDSLGDETRVFVQKTHGDGAQQWLKVFDWNGSSDSGDQEGRAVEQSSDGGYIIAGYYELGADPGAAFLLKLDANGAEQWGRTYDLGHGSEVFSAVALDDNGGYIAAGRTNSIGAGSYDALVVKTDAVGNQKWSEVYGGTDYDAAFSVRRTGDGGHILGGKAVGLQWAGGTDMYLIRMGKDSPPAYDYAVYLPMALE